VFVEATLSNLYISVLTLFVGASCTCQSPSTSIFLIWKTLATYIAFVWPETLITQHREDNG
jgi:hypothetical protein